MRNRALHVKSKCTCMLQPRPRARLDIKWAIPFFYPYRGAEGKFHGGLPEAFSEGVGD